MLGIVLELLSLREPGSHAGIVRRHRRGQVWLDLFEILADIAILPLPRHMIIHRDETHGRIVDAGEDCIERVRLANIAAKEHVMIERAMTGSCEGVNIVAHADRTGDAALFRRQRQKGDGVKLCRDTRARQRAIIGKEREIARKVGIRAGD